MFGCSVFGRGLGGVCLWEASGRPRSPDAPALALAQRLRQGRLLRNLERSLLEWFKAGASLASGFKKGFVLGTRWKRSATDLGTAPSSGAQSEAGDRKSRSPDSFTCAGTLRRSSWRTPKCFSLD